MLAWRDARSATSVSLSFYFFLKGTRMVLFSAWSGRADDSEKIFNKAEMKGECFLVKRKETMNLQRFLG